MQEKSKDYKKLFKVYSGKTTLQLEDTKKSLVNFIGKPNQEGVPLRIEVINDIIASASAKEKAQKSSYDDMPEDLIYAITYANKAKNANQRNIPFELSFNEYKKIASVTRCYYTGKRFSNDSSSPTYKTLDRIDSSKGYTKDNTVACCHAINQLKNDMFEKSSNIRMTQKQAMQFISKIIY